MITPKNWATFQHYSDRKPSWIKLHRSLLDDYAFACLPVASRALAPCLWLLASEYKDGQITATLEEIAFRLRMPHADLCEALHPLAQAGFFILDNELEKQEWDASTPLAQAEQSADVEKEKEKEKEECPNRVRTDYSEQFENGFWKPYPKTPVMSKKQAYAEWKKLSEEDREDACLAVPRYAAWLRSKPDHPAVHACRFLSQRRFDGFKPQGSTGITQEQIDWEHEVLAYKNSSIGHWPYRRLGPEPGYGGCKAPREILEKYGYASREPSAA